jgi:ankyrin repeat protein
MNIRATVSVMAIVAVVGISVSLSGGASPRSFWSMVNDNDLSMVERAISKGQDVNAYNGGETPLYMAAKQGNLDMVKLLLSRGAKYDLPTSKKNTPLHISAELGHEQVVELLLHAGADINAKGEAGLTPLQAAIWGGKLEVVKLLLQRGANINLTSNGNDSSLHIAAQQSNAEVVKLCLENGVPVNITDDAGLTPLHFAVDDSEENAVVVLLEAGADVNARDKFQHTPLHYACLNDNIEKSADIVEVLLKAGADVNAKDEHGVTALHFACLGKKFSGGVVISTTTDSTGTKVWKAPPFYDKERIVRLLVDAGADVNAEVINGKRPLTTAKERGLGVTQAILEKAGAR